jgi:hypothetical protein
MVRKCDTTQQRDDVDRMRDNTRREKGVDDVSWANANLTVPKNKENQHR